MLVLSRKIGERIFIEPGIEIAIVDVRGGRVRIGVDAPEEVRIRRISPAPEVTFGMQRTRLKAGQFSD